jgi:hypothetical protein
VLLWVARRAAVRLLTTHIPDGAVMSLAVRKVLLEESIDGSPRDAPEG